MEEKKPKQKKSPPFPPWINHPFFKYAVGTLLILLILLVLYYDTSFFRPVLDFISILFIPIVLSLLLYYLLRPIVYWIEGKLKIPRWGGILVIYLIFAVLIILFFAYLGPTLIKQMTDLANTSLETIGKIRESANAIVGRIFSLNLDREIDKRLFDIAQQLTSAVSKNALDLISFLTRIAVILAIIPFIVFYLLKDDEQFSATFLKAVPEEFGREAAKILRNMDETLSNYIKGLVMVSSAVGVMLFFGYLFIGLN
jgi:predicted PurR-regulated permease PerM